MDESHVHVLPGNEMRRAPPVEAVAKGEFWDTGARQARPVLPQAIGERVGLMQHAASRR